MSSHSFRTAVENQDHAAMVDEMADDIIFHSPVAFKPFDGKAAVAGLFTALLDTFDEFEYTDELTTEGTTALIFKAKVGDKRIQGLDLMRFNDQGKVSEFTVMMRPLSALIEMGNRMAPKVEGLAKADSVPEY